jgi:hypothetical protein
MEEDNPTDNAILRLVTNTKERWRAYLEYDKSLSGKVFKVLLPSEQREACSDKVKEVLQ